MSSIHGVNVGGNLFDVTDSSNIAPMELTGSATRSYTKGRLLILSNGLLYKTTRAINSGETLVANNNIRQTNMDELIAELDTDSNLIAPTEDGTTSSNDYSIGEQIARSGILYEVIADITAGDTFVVDNNIKLVEDVTKQLSSLKNTLMNETSDIVNVLGAKNLLPNAATTQVVSGITFTIYSDGSVKADGTASANIWFVLTVNDTSVNLSLEHGKDYILSGCPSEGSNDNYYLYVEQYYDGEYQRDKDYGNGVQFTGHSRTKDAVAIYVKSGTVMSNLMFYPMIRPASIEDDTYVPYAMTNRELSEYCLTDYSNFEEISDYITETYQTFSAPYSGWYYASASTGGTTNFPFLRFGILNGYVFEMHGSQAAYHYVTSPVIFIKKGTTMVAQGNSGCINKLFIKKCNL